MSQEAAQLLSTFEQFGYSIGVKIAAARPPAAPAVPAEPPRRQAAGRPSARKAAKPSGRAGAPRIGSRVWYRQGRGEFEARVLRVNENQGVATLERLKDFKRVIRPLVKVYPAPAKRR